MIMDRKTDMVTGDITSTNAVLRNKPALFVWTLTVECRGIVGLPKDFEYFRI